LRLDVPYRRQLLVPASLELRADGDDRDEFILSGHAAVFDRLSEDLGGFRERIKRGAFRRALDEHQDVRLLINHDGLPLARTRSGTLELREDPRGLFAYAKVPATERTRELRVLMQRGDIDQMSFAFSLAADGSGEEWKQDADGLITRDVVRVEQLYDASVVTYPAYPQTDASMRSVDINLDGSTEIPPELAAQQGATAGDGDAVDAEARVALLRELQDGSKRRLSLAIHT
jgi:uncharacterized protein